MSSAEPSVFLCPFVADEGWQGQTLKKKIFSSRLLCSLRQKKKQHFQWAASRYTAQSRMKDEEMEQFQLTYAKVKVISMDKEEDKRRKRRKFLPVSLQLQESEVEQRRAHFAPPVV